MQQIRKGDITAFRELYLAHVIPLVRYARSIIREHEAAEDIVQDVFATIWARRETWNPLGQVAGYLYRAVRNKTLNVVAHRDTVSRVAHETLNTADSTHNPVTQGGMALPPPDLTFEQSEAEQKIIKAISTLPERRRFALILRAMHDLDYAEIASAMEITEGAARILVSRAREDLRIILSTD